MWRWRALGLGFVLAACTDGPPPSSIQFHVQAFEHDGILSFWANAYDLSKNGVAVDDAEIRATFRGQTIPLISSRQGPQLEGYQADLSAGAADDEPVSFTVAHGGTSSTVSGTMPADFAITPVTDPKVGAPIDLAWSPGSNDAMNWLADSCTQTHSFNGQLPSDSGMFEFPSGSFGTEQDGCDVRLVLVRMRSATPESAFSSVTFETDRQHAIAFTITP